jgi:transcriptional regulator with XRE-family HTH domain
MNIGGRLRTIRESRKCTQRNLEKRAGLKRWCVSRIESGREIPELATLEKCLRALDVPMYKLFYEGGRPQAPRRARAKHKDHRKVFGKEFEKFEQLCRHLASMNPDDRRQLLNFFLQMSRYVATVRNPAR